MNLYRIEMVSHFRFTKNYQTFLTYLTAICMDLLPKIVGSEE